MGFTKLYQSANLFLSDCGILSSDLYRTKNLELINQAVCSKNSFIRWCAVRNPRLTAQQASTLAMDTDAAVRMGAMYHAKLPIKVLTLLLLDESLHIVRIAKQILEQRSTT